VPSADCLSARSGETFGDKPEACPLNLDLVGWAVFVTAVPTVLALDLLVFSRRPHAPSLRDALSWVGLWFGLGLLFAALVFATRGSNAGTEYLTGYLLEYSLSMDNVFVFAVLFAYFGVPREHQHRLLYWGVIGAIFFRALFIVAGSFLLEAVHGLVVHTVAGVPLAQPALLHDAHHVAQRESLRRIVAHDQHGGTGPAHERPLCRLAAAPGGGPLGMLHHEKGAWRGRPWRAVDRHQVRRDPLAAHQEPPVR
jgi:hypothetical protein